MHNTTDKPLITDASHTFSDEELDNGIRFAFEPGNGTHMEMMMLKNPKGSITAVIGWSGAGRGAYDFGGWADTHYVAEKLNLLPGDASYVARLINAQNQI